MESIFAFFFIIWIVIKIMEGIEEVVNRQKNKNGEYELNESKDRKSSHSNELIQSEGFGVLSQTNRLNSINSFPICGRSNLFFNKRSWKCPSNKRGYYILDITQRSSEWLKWRSEGIGASDAPVIMGESPWKTSKSLLKEKIYGESEWRNEKMIRGIELEPKALEMYQKVIGVKMRPVCIQSKIYPWLRASLDGLSYDETRVVEIKCGEGVYRRTYYSRKVPSYYYAQLQHILAITGLPSIDFWCFLPNNPYVHLVVERDNKYIGLLLEAEKEFWDKLCKIKSYVQ